MINKSRDFLGQRVGLHSALNHVYRLGRPDTALINAILEQYSPQSIKGRIGMFSALDQLPVFRG